LAEVVRQQDYAGLLAPVPPIDAGLAPQARLAALLRWIWEQMAGQDDMWRLLLGESLRGDAAVMGSAAELSAMFEAALDRWILELFGDRANARPLARVLRGLIYGFFIEYLPLPYEDRMRYPPNGPTRSRPRCCPTDVSPERSGQTIKTEQLGSDPGCEQAAEYPAMSTSPTL
jgi:hypothetical protein